jgi:hypothetical protein
MAYFGAKDIPAFFQMVVEGLGFVLGQHDNFKDLGIDAIAQGKIDQPVRAAEGHRRFGALLSERHEPLASAAGHDNGKNVFHDLDETSKIRGFTE